MKEVVALNRKARRNLIEQAQEVLNEFGIRWHLYKKPKIEASGCTCQVVWVRRHHPKIRIVLSKIWPDDDGNLLAYGSEFGDLLF